MAPRSTQRSPKPKELPDGAKPGAAEVIDPDEYAIDVDARAGARERATITIGGRTYFRRRKTWEVSREIDALITKQSRAVRRAARYAAQIEKLEEEIAGVQDPKTAEWKIEPCSDERFEEIEDAVAELEDKKLAASAASSEAAIEILAFLLRDEGGSQPDTLFLKQEVDVEDVIKTATLLAGGGEPNEGPTPTEPEDS